MILGEPIILGGGNGIPVEIIVNTEAGAEVLAINGTTILSTVADENGKATLKIKKEGTWIIQASLNGETVETTIFIEHKISEEFPFVDPVLANNSWEKISEVARAGKASQYWNVGDTKPFVCNGTTYEAQIIGFDHDDVTDSASYGRSKAGITFQFKGVTSGSTVWDTSIAGRVWSSSSLRNTTMSSLLNGMGKLQNYIVGVNKECQSKTGAFSMMETIEDKLFCLSEYEIKGTKINSYTEEGQQYEFYKAGNSAVKYFGSTKKNWWTRSLYGSSSLPNYRNYIGADGSIAYEQFSKSYCSAPAFCL